MKFKKTYSDVYKFRKKYLNKGYDLVNITTLCEPKLGTSGWCNDFNEPDDTIHHIQLYYRNEIIANINPKGIYVIDDKKYCVFVTNKKDKSGPDFIIFRKVKEKIK